jgi:hypothetical protein
LQQGSCIVARVALVDPTTEKFPFTYLPTGLYSIAAALEAAGHTVSVHVGDGPIPACDYLGVSATMHQYSAAITIAHRARAHTRILGGPYVTTCPAVIGSPVFDYGVVGDGEVALTQLIGGYDQRRIRGLVYKSHDVVMVNPPAYLTTADLPTPAYGRIQGNQKLVSVSKSRSHRYDGIMWDKRHVMLHAKRFNAAMQRLYDSRVQGVHVVDESFAGDRVKMKMAVETLDMFTSWSCRADVRGTIDRRLDQGLTSSRCARIELFVGTASGRLAAEHNLPSSDQSELAIDLLSRFGLTLHVLLGLPGETVASLKETRHWLQAMGLPARIETFVAWPGTPAWEGEYDRFGFDVRGCNCRDYYVDDSCAIADVPWRSNTIAHRDFIEIRNEMIEEFRT